MIPSFYVASGSWPVVMVPILSVAGCFLLARERGVSNILGDQRVRGRRDQAIEAIEATRLPARNPGTLH